MAVRFGLGGGPTTLNRMAVTTLHHITNTSYQPLKCLPLLLFSCLLFE